MSRRGGMEAWRSRGAAGVATYRYGGTELWRRPRRCSDVEICMYGVPEGSCRRVEVETCRYAALELWRHVAG